MNESQNFPENNFHDSETQQFKIDIGKAFLVAIIIITSLVVAGTLVSFPTLIWEEFYHISLPLSFLLGGMLAIFVLILYLKINWKIITTHLKNTPKWPVLVLSVLIYFLILPFAEYLTSIFPTTGNKFLEELYKSTTDAFEIMLNYKIAGFITVCILAPVFEEILFRGILLRGMLQNRTHPVIAIVLSSFLFGLAHMNPWQFLGAGVLGATFAYIYYRTKSLWICIFLHSLNNTISYILMIKFQSIEENVTDPNDLTSVLICLMVALLTGFGIYKFTPTIKWN